MDKSLMGVGAAAGAAGLVSLTTLGLNVKSISSTKKALNILKNDPKKSMEMYKKSKSMDDFKTWRNDAIKALKYNLIILGVGTGASVAGMGLSAYYGKKTYDTYKDNKKQLKENYDSIDAFLEGYSDALLEMEEDNNYEDAYLEGYYAALESNDVAKDYYRKKHGGADIASGLLPFTNSTQAYRAHDKFSTDKSLKGDYKEYVSLCRDVKEKPMSEKEFIKKAKEFYRRRATGKGISAGMDLVTVNALRPAEAIFNHFYEREAFKY